jgi:hypothetical protein
MTAGTPWHLTLVEDGEPGETQEMTLEGIQDVLAEFFARAETEPGGIGFFVSKAAMDPVEYINAAPDHDERRRRKSAMFQQIYGGGGVKYTGSRTGRFTVASPPPFEEVPRRRDHLRRVK